MSVYQEEETLQTMLAKLRFRFDSITDKMETNRYIMGYIQKDIKKDYFFFIEPKQGQGSTMAN